MDLLGIIRDYLNDELFSENKMVTYKSLSYKFRIHNNEAKFYLQTFYDANKDGGKNLNAIFYLSGYEIKDSTKLLKVRLVRSKDLSIESAKLDKIVSCHVYCLQCFDVKDIYSVYLFDEATDRLISEYTAIKCPHLHVRKVENTKESDESSSLVVYNTGKDIIDKTKVETVESRKDTVGDENVKKKNDIVDDKIARSKISVEKCKNKKDNVEQKEKKNGETNRTISSLFTTMAIKSKDGKADNITPTKRKGRDNIESRDDTEESRDQTENTAIRSREVVPCTQLTLSNSDLFATESSPEKTPTKCSNEKDDLFSTPPCTSSTNRNRRSSPSLSPPSKKKKKLQTDDIVVSKATKKDDARVKDKKFDVRIKDKKNVNKKHEKETKKSGKNLHPFDDESDFEDFIPETPDFARKSPENIKMQKMVHKTYVDDEGYLVTVKEPEIQTLKSKEKEMSNENDQKKPKNGPTGSGNVKKMEKSSPPPKKRGKPAAKTSPAKKKQSSLAIFFKK